MKRSLVDIFLGKRRNREMDHRPRKNIKKGKNSSSLVFLHPYIYRQMLLLQNCVNFHTPLRYSYYYRHKKESFTSRHLTLVIGGEKGSNFHISALLKCLD